MKPKIGSLAILQIKVHYASKSTGHGFTGVISIHTNPYNALLRSIQDKFVQEIFTIHLRGRGVFDLSPLSPFYGRIKVVIPGFSSILFGQIVYVELK